MPPRIVLGSTSTRRRELLERLGVPFTVRAPEGIDEDQASGRAFVRCEELARRKAASVLRVEAGSGDVVVLGADTLVAVVSGGQEHVLGQPRDPDDARDSLKLLSGKTHRVFTGVALAAPGRRTRSAVEVSLVTFRELSEAEIDAYVASEEPMGKAGAYGIQSAGAGLVRSFRGCYYNIVGLPLRLVARLLGVEPVLACDCRAHTLQGGEPGCSVR